MFSFMATAQLSKTRKIAVCLPVAVENWSLPITVTTVAKARQCFKVHKSHELSLLAVLNNPVKIHSCLISRDSSKDTELMAGDGLNCFQCLKVVFHYTKSSPISLARDPPEMADRSY
ncbi:mCG148093 [Mus musculus]|jgi:hypothetical protein|uniref:Uncharacterized protein n=1 Tax=Mus musculus TaxID=10090 RepID=Q8C8J5_MOUSE|nr:mCG148093 [Mus musculus]BAC32917.1 unnamed protein product [Mus musculus]